MQISKKKIVEKIAGGGIVIYDSRVLVLQRASDDDYLPDLWEIPSGKRDDDEKIEDTVKREVEEETGLKVKIDKIIDSFKYVVEKPDEIRNVTQICYLVKPIDGFEVKLSSEHQNFAWITKEEIDDYNISKETKEIVRKAFKDSSKLE